MLSLESRGPRYAPRMASAYGGIAATRPMAPTDRWAGSDGGLGVAGADQRLGDTQVPAVSGERRGCPRYRCQMARATPSAPPASPAAG